MTDASDQAAITDVLVRYCHAVDHLDWDELRRCYHEDATDCHGGYRGTALGFFEWVQPQFTGRFDATMHALSNVVVTLDGRRARTTCQVRADHFIKAELGGGIFQFWGDYVDVFEKRDEWKIAHRLVVQRFVNVVPSARGNGAGFQLSSGATYVQYRRGADDPTYWTEAQLTATAAPEVTA